MIDRIGLAISAAGVPACLMLVAGAARAYMAGDDSGWFISFAVLLQIATVWQLVRDVKRHRGKRHQPRDRPGQE
ncbi:hypothetical protein ACH4ND_15305 [Streptomyces sp. NPDC017179]|uniref:hypothetical protein n=1 Tax=Streptomyces sp. NPDC017179 TaxID=3364979 RepID=UPI0037B4A3B8